MMVTYACNIPSCSYSTYPFINNQIYPQSWGNSRNSLLYPKQPAKFSSCKVNNNQPEIAFSNAEERRNPGTNEEKGNFKWVEIGPDIAEEQKQAIAKLPFKMTKRCKALMKQIICFCPERGTLACFLVAWVKIMRPKRADWLAVLKELKIMEHPLYFEVAELALLEESFEANIHDYTKIIHGYGKRNRLQEAENILVAMKRRGFICDQVTLTTIVHRYSKAGNLKLAEETFEDIKLLGQQLDKRSYGSMIMAYVRAEMPEQGEVLLREMDSQETYAGSEVYKALLRAYSMLGDAKGAQRVFDAIQLTAISPDAILRGLLINAYQVAGQSEKAHMAFENMRRAGLEPSDKCVALVLAAYERQNKLNKALDFLMDLERDGIVVGEEASGILAQWFKKLGVVEHVELVLREFAAKQTCGEITAS